MPYRGPTEPCVNKMKWEYFCKFSAVCLLQLHRAQKRKHYFEQSKPLLTALFCLFFEILGMYECGLDYRLTWSSLIHYRKFLYKIILCKIVCKLAGGVLNVQFYSSRVGLNMYPLATSKYIVVFELYVPSSIDISTVQISITSGMETVSRPSTNTFSDHSLSIIHLPKLTIIPSTSKILCLKIYITPI